MSRRKSKTSGAGSGTGPGRVQRRARGYRRNKRAVNRRDGLFVEEYLSNGGCIDEAARDPG
jgi:hypothetical protein